MIIPYNGTNIICRRPQFKGLELTDDEKLHLEADFITFLLRMKKLTFWSNLGSKRVLSTFKECKLKKLSKSVYMNVYIFNVQIIPQSIEMKDNRNFSVSFTEVDVN